MNNLALVHDLLATVDARPVRDALAAYDRAATAQAGHRPPPEHQRHKAAEAALESEHAAAALEGRPPRLTAATLTAADEAAIDDQMRTDALERVVTQRTAELDAAVEANSAHVWHAVAVARAAALTKDPALDPVPAPLEALWGAQLRLPAQAWCPAVVHNGEFQRWDVPALRAFGIVPGPRRGPNRSLDLASIRQVWDAHLWAQMALPERKGWRLADGMLRLVTPWPAGAPARPGLADDPGYSPPNVHRLGVGGAPRGSKLIDGDVVWVGTGPNGERGATADDIAGLTPAGMQW